MHSSGRVQPAARLPAMLVAVWIGAALACAAPGSGSGYPSQPVELVVPFPAGGGSDTLARLIQAIVTEEGLVERPINIINRPGGAGAVGLAYTAARRGDTHTLMTVIDTLVSVPLQPGYTGPGFRDLTLVAILALDDMIVTVPAGSPFRTIEALIEHARVNPGSLTLATNAAGGEDHIFGGLIEQATGARFSYVHTRGGAEAMQNLVGSHVDIAVPNPSETLSQLQGGLVRALAVGAPERLTILPDVPTLRERGIDVEFRMFRGVTLPGDVPPDIVRYWQDVLRAVTASPRWQRDYLDRLALTPHFLAGDEALEFLEDIERLYRSTLVDLGMVGS